jgi:uncharacterized protein (DUF2147 family)
MREKRSIYAALAALLLGPMAAWADPASTVSSDPIGEWLVAKEVARIRIVDCDQRLWGVVSWEARAGVDSHNPDPAKRTRPTLGMPILLGMTQTKANRWDGEIYNSEDGHTYSANISLLNPDTLRVQGCFLAILCGGENWTRVQPLPAVTGASQPQSTRPTNLRSKIPTAPPIDNPNKSADEVCLRLTGPPGLPH